MIQQYFIAVIIVPLASVILATIGRMIKALLLPKGWSQAQMKPIDCARCLCFWINLLANSVTMPDIHGFFYILFTSLAAACIAAMIESRL